VTSGSAKWDWENPVPVVAGAGLLERVDVVGSGRRVAIVTTAGAARRGELAKLQVAIGDHETLVWDRVTPNPSLLDLDAAIQSLRKAAPDVVVALGGGSAIDSGKVIVAGLRAQGVSLRELVSAGAPTTRGSISFVAIPTTSGTGSEVTPFATVWDTERKVKMSLAGRSVFPDLAVLDSVATLGAPRLVTVASGLDALSQACESVWNRNANPVTMAFALEGARLALEALPRVVADPADLSARTTMMRASLLSGLAISRTRTAISHSISYPLTAHFGIAHGIACSYTLPRVLGHFAASDDGRLSDLARALGETSIQGAVDRLKTLLNEMDVGAELSATTVSISAVRGLRDELMTPGRGDNTFVPLTAATALDIAVGSLSDLKVGG
jgi:alcohol dehydrogenase